MPHTLSLPFAAGSNTSRKAAEKQARNRQRGAKVAQMLLLYRQAGADGISDERMAQLTGFLRSSICSMRGKLMEDGLVAKGREVPGTYGPVTAWFWIGDRQ